MVSLHIAQSEGNCCYLYSSHPNATQTRYCSNGLEFANLQVTEHNHPVRELTRRVVVATPSPPIRLLGHQLS
jgi:hypothetical protein